MLDRDAVIAAVKDWTVLDRPRLESLWALGEIANTLPGVYVECGCARGGSAALLAASAANAGKRLIVYDTFAGLPPLDPTVDTARGWTQQNYIDVVGSALGHPHELVALARQVGATDDPICVKGLFSETLPHHQFGPICFLHADSDWAYSTRDIFENLWHHLAPGAVIQVDDYHFWAGCKTALDHFLLSHPATQPLSHVSTATHFRTPL